MNELWMDFNVKDVIIGGDECIFVTPLPGTEWNPDNLIYRSSVWRKSDMFPVSLSFRKFFNLTEKPQIVPDPTDISQCTLVQKIDGTLLIVSKYNGELIVRTRGNLDARSQENGFEIDEFIKKHPEIVANQDPTWDYSLLFEWTSPFNRIIIDYGEHPQLWLVAMIEHHRYQYISQSYLDTIAESYEINRPVTYHFHSLSNAITEIEQFPHSLEGVCCYYHNGQDIKKIKGLRYLTIHAFKSHLTIESIIEMFIQEEYPSYPEFIKKIENILDYECANYAKPYVSKICNVWEQVENMKAHMQAWIHERSHLSRKEIAYQIQQAYPGREGYVFSLLDNNPWKPNAVKKLIHQVGGF